jgi:hypothetical protein
MGVAGSALPTLFLGGAIRPVNDEPIAPYLISYLGRAAPQNALSAMMVKVSRMPGTSWIFSVT